MNVDIYNINFLFCFGVAFWIFLFLGLCIIDFVFKPKSIIVKERISCLFIVLVFIWSILKLFWVNAVTDTCRWLSDDTLFYLYSSYVYFLNVVYLLFFLILSQAYYTLLNSTDEKLHSDFSAIMSDLYDAFNKTSFGRNMHLIFICTYLYCAFFSG